MVQIWSSSVNGSNGSNTLNGVNGLIALNWVYSTSSKRSLNVLYGFTRAKGLSSLGSLNSSITI